MDYLHQIADYVKDLKEILPRNLTLPFTMKTATQEDSSLPSTLSGGFGVEHYVFAGLAIVLVIAMFVLKYDSYRFRVANREMRQEVSQDVRHLLEEKFNEEFFDSFMRRIAQQSSQSTQVESSELNISTSTAIEEPVATSPVTTPKTQTPRQSRIPVAQSPIFTPVRRSNSDASPVKRAERGDPGISIRSPGWERRLHR